MSTNPISAWIDDRAPRVRFNGEWRLGGIKTDFNGTESSSTRVGDSFVVPFYGQSIIVYGTIDATSGGVVTNYSIDGMPPAQVTSQRGATDTGRQQFWASSALNVTSHELTVTMAKVNNDPEDGEGTIWFDYFTVYDPSGHERMPQPPSKKTLSKGAIAGVVVGSVIFLALLLLGAYFWMRKRRLKSADDETRPHRYVFQRDPDLRDYTPQKHADMESLGSLDARSRLSRSGIQPFTLGSSVSSSSSQGPPAAVRKSKVPEEAISGRDQNNNSPLPSSSSRFIENITPGTITLSNSQASPSSSNLRPTHKSVSSSGADSLRPTIKFASLTRSTNDGGAVETGATLSGPTSAIDLNHGGSGGQASLNHAPSSSALPSDPSSLTDPERPASSSGAEGITNHPINSTTHPEQVEEGELQSRSMIQHVDSGIRLGTEAMGPPIELPPVYSPT